MSTTRKPRCVGLATRTIPALLVLAVFALVLGGCGGGTAGPAASTTPVALGGPTYSTTAFSVPFDVTVPEWLPGAVTSDTVNFVTWDSGEVQDPAVRFLVPVDVYRPGDTGATPPPEDYLAYLLSQSEQGATFTDKSETTVDGKPATLVTATAQDSLDGSLGCPAQGVAADDCFGLQQDLTLRIAVVDVGDRTLLVWLRHSGAGDTKGATREFDAFEQMVKTVRFRDEAPSTPAMAATPTPIDGKWTTSITKHELTSSPLLDGVGEVNDENFGDFTFAFKHGKFALNQTTAPRTSIAGTFVVDADVVQLNLDNGERFEMRYSVKGDVLAFERDESIGAGPTPLVLKPWKREATP